MLSTFPVAEGQEENCISCQRSAHQPHTGQRGCEDTLNQWHWESQLEGRAINLQVELDDYAEMMAGTGLPHQQQKNSEQNLPCSLKKVMDMVCSNVKRNSTDGETCCLFKKRKKASGVLSILTFFPKANSSGLLRECYQIVYSFLLKYIITLVLLILKINHKFILKAD